jgi:hypothetical protein
MIRVQVGRKRDGQIRGLERLYSLVEHCFLGSPDNARTKVNQVGSAVNNNRCRGARPVRIWKGVARPK